MDVLTGLVLLQTAKNMPSRKNNKPLYLAACRLAYFLVAHQYDANSSDGHQYGADDGADDGVNDGSNDSAIHITRITIMISRPSVRVEITSCP